MRNFPYFFLDKLFIHWLEEDLKGGDITSEAIVPDDRDGVAYCIAKESLYLCGIHFFSRVFKLLDPRCEVIPLVDDGVELHPGKKILTIRGPIISILKGERVALNILQQLSGITSLTKKFVKKVEGKGIRIADTRKTLPGWRWLQRYAVRIGGGINHRYDLGSGILIKENHIKAAGSISRAVEMVRRNAPHLLKISVEVTNKAEILEALDSKAEVLLLDNFSPDRVREAISIIGKRAIVEVSGGITLDNIEDYAIPGVDIISVGTLTHSAPASDISLLIE